MSRPDYIACVARTHVDHKRESWCGRDVSQEWHFVDAAHAAESGLQGGRMVVCPECYEALTMALSNGSEDVAA